MENPKKVAGGRRKENVPPRLSCDAPSGDFQRPACASYQGTAKRRLPPSRSEEGTQRGVCWCPQVPGRARGMSHHGGDGKQSNIQKNVNVNLFLDSFSNAAISRHSSRAAVPASDHSGAAAPGKTQIASVRGAKPHCRVLVQTNLSCPYQPSWDTPGGVSGGSSRQQSNLETKLVCRRLGNVACAGNLPCLCAVDPGPSCPCSDQIHLKSSPKNDFLDRRKCGNQKPRGGLGLRGDVPRSCSDTSQTRSRNKDPHLIKHPRGSFCISDRGYRTLGTTGGSFCPTRLYKRPSAGSFRHHQHLHPENPCGSLSSSPPGPALTLDHLRTSTSAESHATSTTLQDLLSSSHVSADLHGSIRRLKQEADSMGALGSFPWEPKPFPLPHPSRLDSRVSSSTAEQSVGEESCAKQAHEKWRNSFARDWGFSSTIGPWEEPPPFGYGCRNTGLHVHPIEASDPICPSAFYGGDGSTLVCREEGCSNPTFCYRGCCPGIQRVLERKGPSGLPKTHYHQKMLDAEELSSKFFHPPKLGRGDSPLCRPSFSGLEVSLETLHDRTPVTVGVTVDNTQREVHVMVQSLEVDQLGNGSKKVDLHGLQDEPADVDGVLPTLQTMGEAAIFLPACSSLEEVTGKCPVEHSSASTDGLGPTGFGGSASGSKNSSNKDCWADVGLDRDEESPTEKNAESSTFLRFEESRHGMDAVQKETLGRSDDAMDGERSRVPPESNLLLANCFAAWRNRVFGRRAAAQALYEWQLLRKGFGALKWAVERQRVQVGVAQRRHSRRILAASFRRWQDATARQQKERASRVEKEACEKDSPAALGGERIAQCPALPHLSAECLEAVAQYGRAEGNLWLQIHRNQGMDNLDRKIQAVRDMWRLAAAFRLWCLQKRRLDAEESRAREAFALLEKKRLRNAFEMWQSRHRAAERILPLMAQIQQRLVSRCFNTWKGFAEREARGRYSWDRRRVKSLRLCFRQWARMVQAQEKTRRTLQELLALRREMAYARFGFALNVPKKQPLLNVVRQSKRNGSDTLDSLYVALALQETFYTWKARWRQQQHLDAFRQTAEQKLLRKALVWWRWRAFCLPPLRCCAEEALLASLDSDEFSVSSGFHSNTPALPASRDWVEKENSPIGSSPASISLVTVTDNGHLVHDLSPSPTLSPGREDLGDDAVEFRVQASSPLRHQHSEKDGFVTEPFESLGFLSPECDICSITASLSGVVASSGGEEKEILEVGESTNQRQLLARYFALWSSRTLQNLKGKQHCRQRLLSWAFISWSTAVAHSSERHKAQVWLESTRRQRLLASCFEKWKAGVSRAHERREEESLGKCKAMWRWRKAVRGSQVLRRSTGTVVQQSSNYWTKAAAFHLCLQERSSLVTAPKFTKMPLSWPSKQRRNREEGLPPSLAVRARLNGSAFHVWLVIYRSQSSTTGPSQQGPPDTTERETKHTGTPNSSAETDSTRWLWKKYLKIWRCNVLLRRFQEAWRIRHLVGAWLLWKDACQAEWVVQALVRQRLAEWGWKTWRRRYLRMRVAEHFLEAQDRSLLKRAFGRWRHLAAKVNDQPQGHLSVSQPLLSHTWADLPKGGS